jgi:hypothetical protein
MSMVADSVHSVSGSKIRSASRRKCHDWTRSAQEQLSEMIVMTRPLHKWLGNGKSAE